MQPTCCPTSRTLSAWSWRPSGLRCFGTSSFCAWASDAWTDLVAEDAEAVLESVTVLDGPELDEDLLVVVRTAHGVARMSLHRAADGAWLRDIDLPGAGTIGGPVEHIDGGPVCWFVFTDHTTVPTVYAYDALNRVQQETNAEGTVTTFSYDASGRLGPAFGRFWASYTVSSAGSALSAGALPLIA